MLQSGAGLATVYLAKDVALKVLKPELAAVVGAERANLGHSPPQWRTLTCLRRQRNLPCGP